MIREIGPASWPDVEKALGEAGGCDGCWCSFWRLEKGEKFAEIRGAMAKRRLHKGVTSGSIHGLVAYIDNEPIGWCTFGPRKDFPGLNRSPRYRSENTDGAWSIPCFFVKAGYRQLGVSSALLVEALRVLRRRKIKIAEGYPVLVPRAAEFFPDFSWTGKLTICLKSGFEILERRERGVISVRKGQIARTARRSTV